MITLGEGNHLVKILQNENGSLIRVIVDEAKRMNVHTFYSLVIQPFCFFIPITTSFQHIYLSDLSFQKFTKNRSISDNFFVPISIQEAIHELPCLNNFAVSVFGIIWADGHSQSIQKV